MAVSDWKFYYNPAGVSKGTEFTSTVLSASMSYGRTKYLDDYNAGTLTITINNSSNFITNFSFNTLILLDTDKSDVTYGSDPGNIYAVQEITFADYPGNIGLSTATLLCVDAFGRAGRVQANALSLPQATTGLQAIEFDFTEGGPLPSNVQIDEFGTRSIASAQTYTGTVLNQLNLLNATERGMLLAGRNGPRQYITFYGRDQFGGSTQPVSFGRTASSSVIGYQQFNRIQNGVSFINTATISPEGLADQTVSNASSVSTYGATFYSSSTVDYNTTQAQGNASWIVNSFSDPTDLRFEIGFTDRAQNDTAYTLFMVLRDGITFNLSYRLPAAGSDTIEQVYLEGYSVNMTPEQTDWILYFSPATYYLFFILDDSTNGILGGGGIVYDQPEIEYDENGWIYDDANVEQGSRLGW